MLDVNETPSIKASKSFKMEVVKITPEFAQRLLGASDGEQRSLNPSTITMYKDLMNRGVWQFNGESIKQDKDGNIIDGQHRLAAIASSSNSIITILVKGLSKDSIKSIDTGKPRTASDVLKMSRPHIKYSGVCSTVARLCMTHEATKKSAKIAPMDVVKYIDNSKVPSIVAKYHTHASTKMENTIPKSAVLATLCYLESEEDRDEMMSLLTYGCRDVENPILLTKIYFRGLKESKFAYIKNDVYLKVLLKAWAALKSGEEFNPKKAARAKK
jgi:hypothetical protein